MPPLYRGPLTVEYVDGQTPEVVYTSNGSRRIDWTYTSGQSHLIINESLGETFDWANFGPRRGTLQSGPVSPALDPLGRRVVSPVVV